MLSFFDTINMEKVSKKWRTYIKGSPLQNSLRTLIIDYFPGDLKSIADKFRVSNTTIKNIWAVF